jgi:hypothetical protein
VFLNLPEPYAGLNCGAAYRPDWNLSLDQIVGFAESQLSACDLAVTVSTIEGDVARAYDKIGLANSQNWIAWSAAAAFLPGPDDPAAEDRTVRVRAAQARIQNARDGLRFLAKLTAVMQHPPAQSADAAFDTVPKQSFPEAPQGENSAAIQQAPLWPPPTDQAPTDQTPATQNPFAAPAATPPDQPAQAPSGTPGTAFRQQIACVTSTAWVLEARPGQEGGQMVIDDPVAGQALVWLSGYSLDGSAGPGIRAFAACPGATLAFSPSTYAPLPGAAQGLTSPAEPAAPAGQSSEPSPTYPEATTPAPQQD